RGRTLYGRWYVSDPAAPDGLAASPSFRFQIFGPHGAGSSIATVTPMTRRAAVKLYASQPNPFAASTLVRFDLPQPAHVRLIVYDIGGRVARHLVDRVYDLPGAYAVMWDGRADDGRALPGGVYLYRLESDLGSQTSRVVRV